MKILDQYVARGFLRYFFISMVVFSGIYVLVDILQRSIKSGLSIALVQYALFQAPFIISNIIPMACLVGSLFTLNNLSKNSELIAMHACGISLYRVAAPILTFSAAIGIINFFISDHIVPPTLRKSHTILQREVKRNKQYQIFKAHKLWYRSKNAIYNIDYFSPDTHSINGINIYLFNDQFQFTEQILAKQALYDGAAWTLHDGVSITFIDEFPVSHAFKTKTAEYIVEKPSDLKEISRLETMNFKELKNYIDKHKQEGFTTLRHEVNLHKKIAYAVACLVMAFLGIPFSAKNPRRGGLTISGAVALSLSFIYWICLNAGISFGYSGALSPLFSAWIANILFILLGLYLLKLRQRTNPSWLF